MSEDINTYFNLLCSHSKLDRDKGILLFGAFLSGLTDISLYKASIIEKILTLLQSSNSSWENIYGALEAGKILLTRKELYTNEFLQYVIPEAVRHLKHQEFRVRMASGELLGSVCKFVDVSYYIQFEKVLIAIVRENLIRDTTVTESETKKDAKDIYHDTEGWKFLETSMKGLQAIIDGCEQDFLRLLKSELLDMLFETLLHTNRFVRETGYYVCASIARFGATSEINSDKLMMLQLVSHLAKGLADNWSQVRLAASVATRQFFEGLIENDKQFYLKQLIAPMCLNRYYLAEGVKLYSQQSWKIILGSSGRAMVAVYINDIVEFYISQTECDNHAVREAACHCIAELALKISEEAVQKHVPRLLEALLVCFKDESWPVRDTACIACGNFITVFPTECRPILPVLFPLFFGNLSDPIPSVRQGAAVSLSKLVSAYREESIYTKIFEKIETDLKSIENQSSVSERYEGLDKGVATYGVIKELHDNDFELHSNQQMYSCGSLAPKMKRGGGCMDHSYKRKSEPWESADGCVFLIAELTKLNYLHSEVEKVLPLLVKSCEYKHYTHYLHYFETVNKVLPTIAEQLGKRLFKRHLETFFDVIFISISSENALARHAARECVDFLTKFIGPNILRGRVEQYNNHYLRYLSSDPSLF